MCTLYTYLYLCEHEQLTRRATHIAVVAAAAGGWPPLAVVVQPLVAQPVAAGFGVAVAAPSHHTCLVVAGDVVAEPATWPPAAAAVVPVAAVALAVGPAAAAGPPSAELHEPRPIAGGVAAAVAVVSAAVVAAAGPAAAGGGNLAGCPDQTIEPFWHSVPHSFAAVVVAVALMQLLCIFQFVVSFFVFIFGINVNANLALFHLTRLHCNLCCYLVA